MIFSLLLAQYTDKVLKLSGHTINFLAHHAVSVGLTSPNGPINKFASPNSHDVPAEHLQHTSVELRRY